MVFEAEPLGDLELKGWIDIVDDGLTEIHESHILQELEIFEHLRVSHWDETVLSVFRMKGELGLQRWYWYRQARLGGLGLLLEGRLAVGATGAEPL